MVLLLPALAGMTDVKMGPVQLSEFYVAACAVLVALPMRRVISRTKTRTSLAITKCFWWFMVIASLGAALAMFTEPFVITSDVDTLLKQPGWISASRLIQLLAAYFCFALVRSYSAASPRFLRKGVRWYVAAATAFSTYGIVSYVLLLWAGIDLGGAYGEEGIRLKSLFVEGGPFGMYAASAIVMTLGQRGTLILKRREETTALAILVVALLLSQSKAAAIAIAATFVAALFVSGSISMRKYRSSMAAVAIIIVAMAVYTDTAAQLGRYIATRELLIDSAETYKNDPNVAMGRIAGAVIIPGMIASNPWLGVGIGNYSLLRNSDEYISGMPAVDAWDLHGLGLFGFTAEVGLLGISLFVSTFIMVIRAAKRSSAGFPLTACSIFPLTAFLFGTQATFIYPWILSAFAVALVDRIRPDI